VSEPAARVGRVKRERSATESLLSITLALEGCLVFFAALAAFALKVVEPAVALGGGALFIALLAVCGRLLRNPIGVWLGWVLQFALIAVGILLPLMYVIGAGFLALWIFCFVKGRSLDRAHVSTGSTTELEIKE
jgi:hypothetical protein